MNPFRREMRVKRDGHKTDIDIGVMTRKNGPALDRLDRWAAKQQRRRHCRVRLPFRWRR